MERINSKHLLVFFLQLIVVLFTYLGMPVIIKYAATQYIDRTGANTGFWLSIQNSIEKSNEDDTNILDSFKIILSDSDVPVEKTELRLFNITNKEKETMITKKTIDLENKKIWFSEEQNDIYISIRLGHMFGSLFISLVFLLIGLGGLFKRIHDLIKEIISPFTFIILPLPFFILAIAWFISTLMVMYTLPLEMLVHLIWGIVQVIKWFKNKAFQ